MWLPTILEDRANYAEHPGLHGSDVVADNPGMLGSTEQNAPYNTEAIVPWEPAITFRASPCSLGCIPAAARSA
ncbi:hypothetical protein [Chitinophaga eiseniae]|uniref:hypothetical protein n=1 Tax=Chitinophaga eiseniae TaxID=634771 RepID=UPI000999B32A|nr:hypothetical protein [Chitinophaga eiseniae]